MRIQRLTNTLGLLWSNSVQLTNKIVQIPRFILGCVLWTAMGLGLVECSSNYIEHNQSNLAYEWLQAEGFEVSDICAPLRGLFVQGSDGIRETWHKDATFLFPSASTYTSQAQVFPLVSEQNALYAEQNASTIISSLPLLANSNDLSSEKELSKSRDALLGADSKSESELKSLNLRERFAFFDEPPLFIRDLQSAKTSNSFTNSTSVMADSAHMQSAYAEKHNPPQSFNHANPESVKSSVSRSKQAFVSNKQETRTDSQVLGIGTHVTKTDNQVVASAKHIAMPQTQVTSIDPTLNYSPHHSLEILNQVKSQLCQQGICEQDYASSPDVYARLLGQALVHWSKSRKM